MGVNRSKNRHSQLTDKEIAVLKANTNFSEPEIREFYEEFKEESPSGKMNKDQFIESYRKMADPDNNDTDSFNYLFTLFDKNGDGTVDFSEFVIACGLLNKKDLDSQLDLSFAIIDTSGDGSISYDEMVNFLNYGKKALEKDGENDDLGPRDIATMIFQMFGLNKQQKLSKTQFIESVKNNTHLKQMFGNFEN